MKTLLFWYCDQLSRRVIYIIKYYLNKVLNIRPLLTIHMMTRCWALCYVLELNVAMANSRKSQKRFIERYSNKRHVELICHGLEQFIYENVDSLTILNNLRNLQASRRDLESSSIKILYCYYNWKRISMDITVVLM